MELPSETEKVLEEFQRVRLQRVDAAPKRWFWTGMKWWFDGILLGFQWDSNGIPMGFNGI